VSPQELIDAVIDHVLRAIEVDQIADPG